eukprot:scaffold367_cov154-Amphora_coffeaeformis.AAC.3
MVEHAEQTYLSFRGIQHHANSICVKRTGLVPAAIPTLRKGLGSMTAAQHTTVRIRHLAHGIQTTQTSSPVSMEWALGHFTDSYHRCSDDDSGDDDTSDMDIVSLPVRIAT